MANLIHILKTSLPTQNNTIDFLFDYFNGLEIECTESNNYYQVTVSPNQYTYCEDISQGLDFLGISIKEVNDYCVISDNMALCLSENWLAYAFVFLTERDHYDKIAMNIIHIDDHSDLMSPFIYNHKEKFYDMLSGNEVIFNKSKSLKKAVQSGAITIGSMLTAIIYAMEYANIIHIKKNAISQEFSILKDKISDHILHKGCQRIIIKKINSCNKANKYFVTDNWNDLEKRINPEYPSLLHIDMDYFNNRYNASTSWMENKITNNPDIMQQKQEIDRLINTIKKITKITEIKYVLIGISPSFYPVEYWESGLNYLTENLKKIGIGVGDKILHKQDKATI